MEKTIVDLDIVSKHHGSHTDYVANTSVEVKLMSAEVVLPQDLKSTFNPTIPFVLRLYSLRDRQGGSPRGSNQVRRRRRVGTDA